MDRDAGDMRHEARAGGDPDRVEPPFAVDVVRARILDFAERRGTDATFCPSDVARDLAGDDGAWRSLMEPVRSVAYALVAEGLVEITQGGVVVDRFPTRGPIRIRSPRS